MVWSPESRCLISACDNGQIYFWSVPTSTQLGFPLRARSGPIINSLAISLDGELMASASSDGTAMLWTTSTRKPFGSVLQHANFVATVAFLPDSQLVANGGGDNTNLSVDYLAEDHQHDECLVALIRCSGAPYHKPP